MKKLIWLLLALWPTLTANATLEPPILWPVPSFSIRGAQTGLASYYGAWHHGRIMRNGRNFDMHKLTAASNTLPLGTIVRISRLDRPWRSVVVEITDTGSFTMVDLDLSYGAMRRLGGLTQGVIPVRIEVL